MASLVDESANAIAEALSPVPVAPSARWRWGTVKAVTEYGTMNVEVGDSILVGIRASRHCMSAKVGDRVRVSYYGTEALVDAIRATDDDYPASFGLRSGSWSIPSGQGFSGSGYKDYTFAFGPFDTAPTSVVVCLAGGSTASEMGKVTASSLEWTASELTVRIWYYEISSSRNPTIRWIAL